MRVGMAEQWVGFLSNQEWQKLTINPGAPPSPLPIPTQFMSNNASVCMFISLYLVCEGVCVPALTVPMCVALILVFPLTIPHLLPPSSSPHFWWLHTHPLLISTKPYLFTHYFCVLSHNHTTLVLFLHRLPYTSTHLFIHWPIHSLISFGFLLPTSLINPSPLFLYLSSLVSRSSLSLPPSPCPLRSPPPFLPSSLSFTQCSVPRSLWLGCSSVAESLCALRCLQSIPSTRAHNQVLPLSS